MNTTFFTIAEVAERLNVCERTVRRWIAFGLLPVHRFGRTVRISEADLAAFLAIPATLTLRAVTGTGNN